MVLAVNHFLNNVIAKVFPYLLGVKNRQRLCILNYHRVMQNLDPMRPTEPTVHEFEWQMELLSKYFNPLPLSEALTLMEFGHLPPRTVCVTFDDGYADNATVALPVLKRFNIPATIFVTTGYLDGGRMWNDTVIEAMRIATGPKVDLTAIGLGTYEVSDIESRRMAAEDIIRQIKHLPKDARAEAVAAIASIDMNGELPTDLMLTSEQLLTLSENGVDIGAHTVTHPILTTLDIAHSKDEILGSKQYLEKITGKVVKHFAYPNGRPDVDYKLEHRDLAEIIGFDSAVTTSWGAASQDSDRWQLPRFTPWDKTPSKFHTRLLLNYRSTF